MKLSLCFLLALACLTLLAMADAAGGKSKPGDKGKIITGDKGKRRPGDKGKPRSGDKGKPRPGDKGKPRPDDKGKPRPDDKGKPRPGDKGKSRMGDIGKSRMGGKGKPIPGDKGSKRMKERKEKLMKRRNEAKLKFKNRRKFSQVENNVGNSTLRADKNGAKVEILREGQVLELTLKHIYEKIANKTERNEYNLKKTKFNVTVTANDNSVYGVDTGIISLFGKLENNATVELLVYMFAESANITGEDGNEYEVVEGGTKVNLEMDWPNEVENLEVKVAVKCGFEGKKGRKPTKDKDSRGMKGRNNKRGPETFSVCPNARMTFSPGYKSNGINKEMDNNYPMPADKVSDEGESEVTLKFNDVKKHLFYDPIAETGDDIGEDPLADDDDSSSAGAISNSLFTIFVAVFFSVFKFIF